MNGYSVDPELSAAAIAKAREQGSISAELIVWVAVRGNLQLALRHPQNVGASRAWVEQFVKDLGLYLVERGLLTPEILAEADRREQAFKQPFSLTQHEDDKDD
jgi:hypothetical protein